MRRVSLIPALVALLLSTAASAQGWQEYVNRENNFQINFPAEPTVTETQYRTVKGTMLPARVFTAVAPARLDLRRHVQGHDRRLQQRAERDSPMPSNRRARHSKPRAR